MVENFLGKFDTVLKESDGLVAEVFFLSDKFLALMNLQQDIFNVGDGKIVIVQGDTSLKGQVGRVDTRAAENIITLRGLGR